MAWSAKAFTFAAFVSNTKLCAIANFGILPIDTTCTSSASPGLAVIDVTSYFMSSVAFRVMTRAGADFAVEGLAVEGLAAEGWAADSGTDTASAAAAARIKARALGFMIAPLYKSSEWTD